MTGNEPSTSPSFHAEKCLDQAELLSARWWQEGVLAAAATHAAGGGNETTRRTAIGTITMLATAAVIVPAIAVRGCSSSQPPLRAALQVQKERGWAAGAPADAGLGLTHTRTDDCDGQPFTSERARLLAEQLRPLRADLVPWYTPTLLQVLQGPLDARLRDLRPILTPLMTTAWARGQSLAELIAGVGAGSDLALVVDLPGPDSVALAAAMAEACHVVFTFDNWPHPQGVVPAAQTLAAVCYYAPRFYKHRGDGARPVLFALDRNRLNPYGNEADRFDNRYVVRLPDAEAMQKLGIQRVLYVTPAHAPGQELDDLNELFVAWRQRAAIEVRMIDLADFQHPTPTPEQAQQPRTDATRHYYGGSPMTHWWFWHHMPWYPVPSGVRAVDPGRPATRADYVPNLRPTQFAATNQRPGLVRDLTPNRSGSSRSSGSWGRTSGSRSSFSG